MSGPSPSVRELAITLPAGVYDAVPVLRLAVVADNAISGGKRAITRNFRATNAADAGRLRRVEWEIWGPIGASVESQGAGLGIDFTQNLETRWERRLTSAGAQTAVTLTGSDPAPGSGPAIFGEAIFGDPLTPFGGGTSGQPVVVFDEQQGYLFASRGRLVTQIDYATWTVVSTIALDAAVRDAATWRGTGKLALGPSAPMVRRVGAGPSGALYENVVSTTPAGSVYAYAVKRGSDRVWYIDAEESGGSYNYLGFAINDFEDLATPFPVGDPEVGGTGIGPYGPWTMTGARDNLYSFTDQGKPVPLSRALLGFLSGQNGAQWADPGWGWNYAITAIGLRAISGGADNPVGIGERMRGFTGHNGVPTAIWAVRGELWAVYEDTSGNLYGYRCAFGPETGGTGQPLMFPWFYAPADECAAVFSSTTPTNPVIIRASGTNMRYQVIAPDGRDDLYPPYVYSTAGGTAYLTTLDRNPSLLKTVRLARVYARGITSGSSWALAVAADPDPRGTTTATYTTIGTVTANGAATITPVAGTAPIANISGRTLKPRLVQVAAGSGAASTPPELDGTLELEYDERPSVVEEIVAVVDLNATGYSNNYTYDVLRQLVSDRTNGPFAIQLPDDLPPAIAGASGGGQKYAMVQSVTARQDVTNADIQAIEIVMHVWPQAEALS